MHITSAGAAEVPLGIGKGTSNPHRCATDPRKTETGIEEGEGMLELTRGARRLGAEEIVQCHFGLDRSPVFVMGKAMRRDERHAIAAAHTKSGFPPTRRRP